MPTAPASTPAERLASALHRLLMDDGQVCLPTVGTFQLSRQPALLNKLEHTATPPSQTVGFNANLVLDDGRLQRYYDEHYPDSEQAAATGSAYISLAADLATVTTALDLRQSVTLPEIGRLFRHYDGRLSFTPSGTNFSSDSYGLPVLTDIRPISRKERRSQFTPLTDPLATMQRSAAATSNETTAPATAPATDLPFYRRPEFLQYLRYGLYLLAIILFFVLVFGIVRNFTSIFGHDRVAIDRSSIPENRLNVPPPARRPPPPDVDASLVRPEEPPRLNERPRTNQNERTTPAGPRSPEPAPAPEAETASPPATSAPASPPPATSPARPTLPPPAANGENVAVIAIGLYGRARNVTKMENRLSDAGYEAYTEPEGALTRIGAYIRYRDPAELAAALADLQRRYTEDAFVLEINGRTLPREEQ